VDKKPNDVGAIWKKTNEKGDYLSISLDIDALLELTGGVISGKVNINGYPITSSSDRAPDYQLKFYPPRTGQGPSQPARPTRPAPTTPPLDDDIPW
jgi:uncharacterized protein (DUF736 family)